MTCLCNLNHLLRCLCATRRRVMGLLNRSADLLHGRRSLFQAAGLIFCASRQILIAASPVADLRGMEVVFESPDSLETTLDLMAFHSVLENLLRNALAYGRERGQVVVKLTAISALRIGLSVADDGPGVPAEDRDKLFDRFFRGRRAAAHGAGLGLAIVKQAVERTGGCITVKEGLQGAGLGFEAELGVNDLQERPPGPSTAP